MGIQASEAKSILEAALLCAAQAMPLKEMQVLLGEEFGAEDVRGLLAELERDWAERGLELVRLSSGWRFQTRSALRGYLERLHPEKPQRYSRAAMETLAVIAYRQPVTRGDIEDIRGVVVSSQIVRQLEERGWIESMGHRDAPGRPALYATTRQFLDDLSLASLADLPALDEFSQPEAIPQQVSLLSEPAAAAAAAVASDVEPMHAPAGVHSEEWVAPQGVATDQSASESTADLDAQDGAVVGHSAPLPQDDLEASAP